MGYVDDATRELDILRSVIFLELTNLLVEVRGGCVSISDVGVSLPGRHDELVWREMLEVKS